MTCPEKSTASCKHNIEPKGKCGGHNHRSKLVDYDQYYDDKNMMMLCII